MRTIYVLMAACLSLQACNDQPTPVSTSVNENSTAKYTATIPLRDAESTPVPPTPVHSSEEYSWELSAALEALNDAEYVWVTGAIPGIKPIDGAEFEGTSRDDAYTLWSALPTIRVLDDYAVDSEMDADDHTATVTSPAAERTGEKLGTNGVELNFDDDGFHFRLPAPIDQHARQPTDW